jgi:hypothetical protein
MARKQPNNVVLRFVAGTVLVALILLGPTALFLHFHTIALGQASQEWTKTEGEVVAIGYISSPSNYHIKYRFSVGDDEYTPGGREEACADT